MNDKTTPNDIGIRTETCFVIDCADCGTDCWDDEGTPHFTSEEALRESVVKHYDWTLDKHGRALCRHCTAKADCEREGHLYSEWRLHHSDPEVQWRYCERCDSELEERFTAMAEDR